MVVNAPQSNIVSAAELAVGLLLAAARHIAPATAALKQGEWKRSKYTGVELYEKTAGIVGLGRIGVLVAQRLSAFGMNVIAYDPYVAAGRAAQMGVRLVSLDELLRSSDVVSVHLPKTPETVGIIGDEQLATGQAVADPRQRRPRRHRRRAGAVRRPQGGPGRRRRTRRLRHRAVHRLAAVRAREGRRDAAPRRQHRRGAGEGRRLGRAVGAARARRRAGARRRQRAGRGHRRGRPPRHPARRAARAASSPRVAAAVPTQLDVEVRGEITAHDVRVLELAALKGVFVDVVEEPVSYVNAPVLAAERGVEVRLTTDAESPDYRNLVTLRGTLADGTEVSVVRHAHRHPARREARRDRRLRRRGRALRPHGRLPLRGPARHRRHRRADARRGRRQHRRHAGQPRPPGRPRAGRDDRRQRDPAPACWTTSSARSAPRPRARSTSPTDPSVADRRPSIRDRLTTGETRPRARPTVEACGRSSYFAAAAGPANRAGSPSRDLALARPRDDLTRGAHDDPHTPRKPHLRTAEAGGPAGRPGSHGPA